MGWFCPPLLLLGIFRKPLVRKPDRGYVYLMTISLHAHVSTASSDCDGPFYRDYVTTLNADEIAEHERAQGINDFHDLHFKERVLGNHVSFHPFFNVKVEVDVHGFVMHEQTDEGYRSAEVRWCEDEDCDPNASSQRDVYAEMMGY